jgi:hypothetical protein
LRRWPARDTISGNLATEFLESVMLRTFIVSSIAALPFLFVQPALAPTCPNTLPHEPIVLFDVTGSTLAGPFDLQLTVYNDGTARVCRDNSLLGTADVRLTSVPPTVARQLWVDLLQLGAINLCDLDSLTSDVPLSTLTILGDATDTRGRTFSWLGGQGAHAQIEQRLFTFIQTHFPGF